MSNNFLFYSNYCQHSKRLIEELKKVGAQNNFSMCCVDDPNINLPPFIQSVPTIYLANERKILVNENLFSWVNSTFRQSNQNTQNTVLTNADITGSNDIMAFHNTEMGSQFSDSYSFIDEGSAKKAMHHSYSYLNDNPDSLPSFTRSGGDPGSSSGGQGARSEKSSSLDKAYEQLMQQRNAEQASNITNMRV